MQQGPIFRCGVKCLYVQKRNFGGGGRAMRKTVVWNADVWSIALLRIKKNVSFFFKREFILFFVVFFFYDHFNVIFLPENYDMMYKISSVA